MSRVSRPSQIRYRELPPSAPLRGIVGRYRVLSTGVLPRSASIASTPSGRVSLAFFTGARPGSGGPTSGADPSAVVAGAATRSMGEVVGSNTRLVIAELEPGGAFSLLGAPVAELTDLVLPAADVLVPDEVDRVLGLGDAPTTDMVAGVDRMLRRMLVPGRALDSDIRAALGLIEASHGRMRISQVVRATGADANRLVRRFRDQVGVTPKVHARQQRLAHALTMLTTTEHRPAEIAVMAGFADQAHLGREVKSMMGVTPTAFSARRPFEDFLQDG